MHSSRYSIVANTYERRTSTKWYQNCPATVFCNEGRSSAWLYANSSYLPVQMKRVILTPVKYKHSVGIKYTFLSREPEKTILSECFEIRCSNSLYLNECLNCLVFVINSQCEVYSKIYQWQKGTLVRSDKMSNTRRFSFRLTMPVINFAIGWKTKNVCTTCN